MKRTASSSATADIDWDELYGRHAEELARFMVKLLGDRERAADLVHDTFVHGMRSAHQLRDHSAVRAWLYQIAANLARNELRRRKLIAFLPFGQERGAEDAFDADAAQVHQALRNIPALPARLQPGRAGCAHRRKRRRRQVAARARSRELHGRVPAA